MEAHNEQQAAVVANDKEAEQLSPVEEERLQKERKRTDRRNQFLFILAIAVCLYLSLTKIYKSTMEKNEKNRIVPGPHCPPPVLKNPEVSKE